MGWANEIFCDLFAIYTLGPAYAWAHFHLTARHESDPYEVQFMGAVISSTRSRQDGGYADLVSI